MSWKQILAEAPQVDDRNGVSYYDVSSKRVLNPVRVPELPFELSLNPYLNCELGCTYCYARDFTNKRQEGSGSFDREIYVKKDAPRVLRNELRRLIRSGKRGKPIALGTATDPYQPVERRTRLTRRLLEALADAGGFTVAVTTKSDLVCRDLDVLRALSESGYVRVNMTITTTDRDLAQSMEPRAPIPANRLRAVERLARAGIPVGVFCMPVLPEITDTSRAFRRLVCAARESGAQYLATRILALRAGVRRAFFAWLQEARPSLTWRYRRMYAGGPNPPDHVAERIQRMIDLLRDQYRMPAWLPYPAPRPIGPQQLSLFAEPEPEPESAPKRGRQLPCIAGMEQPGPFREAPTCLPGAA